MPPPIKLLFGPMLIGVFLNTILYGVMLVQMFVYYQTYKKDAKWIRYFVLYLLIAETVNTGCDIGMMYEPLVLLYGLPEATKFFPMMLATDPILTVAISTPIQMFVAWRISIISQSKWLAAMICGFAMISLGGGIWTGITVTIVREYIKKPELHWPALTWLLASAIADLLITVILVYSLSRRKTGFTGTDDTINRLIRLTLQTGLITAIFAAGDVIFFLVLPKTTLNFIWDFALSKIYTNALISTLNARAGWSDVANGHTTNNVLFGDGIISEFVPTRRTFSTGFRHTTQSTDDRFELTSSRSRTSKIRPDDMESSIGYGIAITKVVERSKDPLPRSDSVDSR